MTCEVSSSVLKVTQPLLLCGCSCAAALTTGTFSTSLWLFKVQQLLHKLMFDIIQCPLHAATIAGELYFSVSTLHMFRLTLAVSAVSSGPGERSSPLISSTTGLTEDICEVSQWLLCCVDGLQHRNILPGWVEVAMFSVLNQDTSYGWELVQHPLYHLLLNAPSCGNILWER